MMIFKKIAIVGVGLIGGSIGLAAKRKKLAGEIVGVCRRKSSLQKALKLKAVDNATLNFKKGVAGADLVIIATSVNKIVKLAEKSIKFMKKGAILADVGSAKEHIVRKIEKLAGKKVNFIGTHPMAGSEKSGVENASGDIFDGAPLVITKTRNTNKKSITSLKKFWESLGCRVFVLAPKRHDKEISLISYLPHVVSSAIAVSQVKPSLRLAAGSLKSTTRVSSSDPELWRDIFLLTRDPLLKSIKKFLRNLKTLEKAIRRKDKKAIKKFLDRAKKISDSIRNG